MVTKGWLRLELYLQMLYDPKLNFDDPRLIMDCAQNNAKGERIREFLMLLAVCHTVIPETVRGRLKFLLACVNP